MTIADRVLMELRAEPNGLDPVEFAERIGVSPTTVRQALHRLRQEGRADWWWATTSWRGRRPIILWELIRR